MMKTGKVKDWGMAHNTKEETRGRVQGEIRSVGWCKEERIYQSTFALKMPD